MFFGEIAALSAAIFWAGNSIALTEATLRIGSVAVNISRMFMASIYLLLTVFIIGAGFDISLNQYILLVLSGFAGLIFGDTFLFKAFQLVGPRIGMLLMSLAPPVASFLAYIFLDEILSVWGILGIFITIFGVSLVIINKKDPSLKSKQLSLKGILFGVFAATGQAVGLILVKSAFNESHLNEFVASFIRIFSSTLVMYLVFRSMGKFKNPVRMFKNDKVALKHTVIASFLGPYFGITASMIAVAYTYVGIASTLMATVPIIMLPVSKFYYKEKLNWRSVLGAFIAVGGVAILFLK